MAAGTLVEARERAGVAVAIPDEEVGGRSRSLRPFHLTPGRETPASVVSASGSEDLVVRQSMPAPTVD